MFGIGTWELVVILVLGLIILGPTKFPEVAKSIGRSLAGLRKSVDEVKEEIDLEGIKSDIEQEAGLEELKQTLDVRADVRRAIADLEEPSDMDEPPKESSGELAPGETIEVSPEDEDKS